MRSPVLPILLFLSWTNLFGQDTLLSSFVNYQSEFPTEKVYLRTDKDIYSFEDSIYFKLHLVEGVTHSPSPWSVPVYLDVLKEDEPLMSLNIKTNNGIAFGAIDIADTLETGKYILRAYTHYQLNFDDAFIFQKEIDIVMGASSLLQSPLASEKYHFEIFPEGGELVGNIPNIVAFKSTDDFGKGVFVKGTLVDENGLIVTTFESEHNGMGKFVFIPNPNLSYRLKYTIRDQSFEMEVPEVRELGFQFTVRQNAKGTQLAVKSNAEQLSLDDVYLLCHFRGRVFDLIKGEGANGYITHFIPNQNLPNGIVHVTLFKKSSPLMERIFYNENTTTIPYISIDKDYQEDNDGRQKVRISLDNSTTDSANASVAILRSGIKYSEVRIRAYLNLVSDIKGYIEEPEYYFDPRNSYRKKHLDLLMMTQGWRRFKWSDILYESKKAKLAPEKNLTISGNVKNEFGKAREVEMAVNILESPTFYEEFKTNEDGTFKISDLDIQDSVTFLIKPLRNKREKKNLVKVTDTSLKVTLKQRPKPSIQYQPVASSSYETVRIYDKEMIPDTLSTTKLLEEVVVSGKRVKEDRYKRPGMNYAIPTRRFVLDSIAGSDSYNSMIDYIRVRVPGVIVRTVAVDNDSTGDNEFESDTIFGGSFGEETRVLMLRNSKVKILVDGIPIDFEDLDIMDPAMIEFFDLLRGTAAFTYNATAAIALYTRNGYYQANPTSQFGSIFISHPGYYNMMQFFEPKYQYRRTSSTSTTEYWHPNITIEDGKAVFEYNVSRKSEDYTLIIEGITALGEPFDYVHVFSPIDPDDSP